MNEKLKNELILAIAEKSHQLWCDNELKNYFDRLKNTSSKNILDRFQEACIKNNIIRNEVVLDYDYLSFHLDELTECVHDYSVFQKLLSNGVIHVKRFVKRNVLDDEVSNLGDHYKGGKENILREFHELSNDSKKEALDGCMSAVNIYIKLCESGISIYDMEHNKDIRNMIGTYIHIDWIKRNRNCPDKSLMVPYLELDEREKEKDLNIFDILLSIVKDSNNQYYVPSFNATLPNYIDEERKVLKQL